MVRFTSTQLRPVLSLRRGMKGPVILEKTTVSFSAAVISDRR
ncbi:hypothetical protein NB694_004410 [Pantoea ananatis]|nr:hypothetical protein [Pantoea ananatis]